MVIKAHITGIFHDAETGMFEACVTLEGKNRTTCHVVAFPGHISAPFKFIRPAAIKAAKAQRGAGLFVSQTRPSHSQSACTHDELFSQPSLLDQILGRAA